MKWEPWVKAVIAPLLLRPATFEEDTQHGTDLRFLKNGDVRIAQRVRKPGYTENYGNEVTLTAKHENGMPCEWDKAVVEAKANLFFYGHASGSDPKSGHLTHWYFIDLDKARPVLLSKFWPLQGPNKDAIGRRCWFYAFKPEIHFPEAIIAKWTPGTLPPSMPIDYRPRFAPTFKEPERGPLANPVTATSLFAAMRASTSGA